MKICVAPQKNLRKNQRRNSMETGDTTAAAAAAPAGGFAVETDETAEETNLEITIVE